MDIFEAISKRKSYRGEFKNDPVSKDDLKKIVTAGLKAPSGCNGQTTKFVIVDDPAILEPIRNLHNANKAMQQCKALIACVIDKQPDSIYDKYSFQVEDCAAAVENMLLAITALGYETVWIDGWLRTGNMAEAIGDLLGLPAEKIVRIVLPIGVPAEETKQPEKLPFDKRAWFNGYQK